MFHKREDGSLKWTDTTEEETQEYLASLEDSNEQKTVYRDILSQMKSLASQTLEGSKNLSSSNTTLMSAIESLSKKPLGSVDIVIPIYGGLHIAKPCIETVLKRTSYPYRLIIVDDCSPDAKTRQWLKVFQKDHPEHKVIFQAVNKGFAPAVNRGIREGDGKYICILNSDVLVTPKWLTKMVLALEADARHAVVNPATNNTALTEIPMQPGMSYLDMNQGFEALSTHKYPEILPTGFCFMTTRALWEEIGPFDEAYGKGYGEETDWHMRLVSHVDKDGKFPRYKAVLADDTYVFHERGSSFGALGEETHVGYRQSGSSRFHKLWPQFKNWRRHNKFEDGIAYLKKEMPERVIKKESGYNIAFCVFSSAFCGGMNFIADIVNEMQERGINAKVVQLSRDLNSKPLPTMGELRCGAISFKSAEEMAAHFTSEVFEEGIIVSATAEMVPFLEAIRHENPKLIHTLFAQSYDPALATDAELKNQIELSYHSVPHIISGAKWLDDALRSTTGRSTLGWVRPGVNRDLFFPRGRDKGDDRLTVAFFLNAKDPYRGFDRALKTAHALSQKAYQKKKDIRIVGIGVDAVQGAPFITCVGNMTQSRLATYLSTEVDVVCDPCTIHSYGMPSIEGMASGCVPVSWDNCGINEYTTNGEDSVILPREATPEEMASKIFDVLTSKSLDNMKKAAVKVQQTRQAGVAKFIKTLETGLKLTRQRRKINVVTPHLRKHGGPTTILHTAEALAGLGHDVTLTTIYPDISPEILKDITVPLSLNWKYPEPCDVLIVNSDNPHTGHFSSAEWAKKKILFKLSHNPRFQKLEDDALKLDWNRIVTSTPWLVDVCENPRTEEGWTHPPKDAETIGWYHYGHATFNKSYLRRKYFVDKVLRIGTLVHAHPLKGTNEALSALSFMKERYGDSIEITGVGEWPDFQPPKWMNYYLNLDRDSMAKVFQQLDIFLAASKTEGLGRMPLEAMSSSCLVVKTPTESDIFKDMDNCIITKGFEAEDLVEGLERVGTDLETFQKIVSSGYKLASKLADPAEYRERWGDLVEELFND